MSFAPNILLIVMDTARADAFEPYGAPAGTTPTISQLASAGSAHPQAFASSSWTVPSHLSLFSGLLPRSAGIQRGGQTPASFRELVHRLEPQLLPSVLSRAGYHCVGLSANGWVSETSGFNTGFDDFAFIANRRRPSGHPWSISAAKTIIDTLRARLDDGATEIERRLTSLGKRHQPLFCFVNLMECHSPYLPPKAHNPFRWHERLQSMNDARRYCTFERFSRTALGELSVPPTSLERLATLYRAAIGQLDAWLARILTHFDEAGILSDTQVIVCSDHGENFGEGGLMGHQYSLDDRLIKVPFISAGPLPLDGGPMMSLVDVPRMVAKGLDLRESPWEDQQPGRSVAVAQYEAPVMPVSAAFDDLSRSWHLGGEARSRLSRSFSCATDGRYKLLRDDVAEQLVDLSEDPLELCPVALSMASTPQDTQTVLRVLRKALDDAEREAQSLAPHVPDVDRASADDDETLAEQMRLLGYL